MLKRPVFGVLRKNGVQRGRTGVRRRCIRASSGVRPPLRRLQGTQEQTTFSQLVFPPRLRGSTWSRFSSARGGLRPQVWQVVLSRAEMVGGEKRAGGRGKGAVGWRRRDP